MDNNLNYGVVGNCRTAALVSARGTIEWMCLPDFDSPSVFASLLDRRKGGCFGFDVAEEYRISQAYIPHTNILATTFSAAEGEFVILDFMPCYRSRRDEHYMPPELYRYVRWVRGRPRLRVHYAPAPDYARGRTEQTVTPEFIGKPQPPPTRRTGSISTPRCRSERSHGGRRSSSNATNSSCCRTTKK